MSLDDTSFGHVFSLAERYGYNANRRVFNGRKYVLLNDALSKKEAQSYVKSLKKIGCLVRTLHNIDGYLVYYHRGKA